MTKYNKVFSLPPHCRGQKGDQEVMNRRYFKTNSGNENWIFGHRFVMMEMEGMAVPLVPQEASGYMRKNRKWSGPKHYLCAH